MYIVTYYLFATAAQDSSATYTNYNLDPRSCALPWYCESWPWPWRWTLSTPISHSATGRWRPRSGHLNWLDTIKN